MPAGFNKCRAQGGRIRTIKPKKGKYLHVCWLNGKSYSGEVHTVKPVGRLKKIKKRG